MEFRTRNNKLLKFFHVDRAFSSAADDSDDFNHVPRPSHSLIQLVCGDDFKILFNQKILCF